MEGGHREQLRLMVEEYGDRVFRLVLRYTGDRHQAEDISQETFLKAFACLDRFDPNRPAGPWLFRIALNLCHNWARGRREFPIGVEESAAAAGSAEESFLEQESRLALQEALAELPENYRLPLLLRHVSELSYSEMSQALGWSLSLVKNRLFRGRIALRKALERREGEGRHVAMP